MRELTRSAGYSGMEVGKDFGESSIMVESSRARWQGPEAAVGNEYIFFMSETIEFRAESPCMSLISSSPSKADGETEAREG